MTDAVIIHLASQVKSGLDVIFLDTGYHFPETIGTRDAVSAVYPVNVINVTPSRTVAEQDAELGPRLYGRNPDLCCYFRKVVPLERALDPYDAWITGVRRDETTARSDTRVVEWDARREMVKVNPIVNWTQEQVEAYIESAGEHATKMLPTIAPGFRISRCHASRQSPLGASSWISRDSSSTTEMGSPPLAAVAEPTSGRGRCQCGETRPVGWTFTSTGSAD